MAEEIKTKSVYKFFEYRLYFGNYIKNMAKTATEIPPLHAKQNVYIKIGDNDYSLALTGLKFTRKVYQPGTIEAEVTIKPVIPEGGGSVPPPSFDNVRDLFMMRQVELTFVDTDTTSKEKQKDKEKTIAKNYYVYMMNPQIAPYSGVMEMYVKLTIHSFDKLMAVDKYCKAYTSKKLSSEILKNEYEGFGFTDNMVQTGISMLKNLKYKDKDNKDVEKIQPYLVQYNESFYDFMVRTANRCGEYFYFEDGKLTLGLPESTAEMIQSYANVTMQDFTDGPLSVEDYCRDSAKGGNTDNDTLNYDAVVVDNAGYPTDSFPSKLQYNASMGGDEYIVPLENKKYYNLNRELCLRAGEQWKTLLVKATNTWVKSEDGNIVKMLGDYAGSLAADSANAAYFLYQNDKKVKEEVEGQWKEKPEHYNNQELVAFSSLDRNGWIGRDFYAKIRKQELQQHRNMICIDMGTSYVSVKLGDKIKVKDLKDVYIVVQVSLVANLVWQRNFRKFDPADSATDIYSDRQSQVIYAIPVNGTEMPPVAPVPMVRKAGPQTAFVVDNDDKKYQGRVRIAYPWQSPFDDIRQKMLDAQESLKKKKNEQAEAEKKKKAMDDAIFLLVNVVKDKLKELEKMSQDDLKKKCKQLEEDIANHAANMVALDKEYAELTKYDTIYNDESDPTEISYEDYMSQATKKNKNRSDYVTEKKNKELKELILEYLKRADCDPKAITKTLNEDIEKLTNDETKLKNEAKKCKDEVEAQEKVLKDKSNEWNKQLGGMATPWVRVATPMATNGGGTFFKPSKGDEVLVNFDDNNIERPYVMGSVYSKNTLAPGEGLDKQIKNYLQKKAQIALMSSNGQHISFAAPSDGWKFLQGFSPSLKTLQTYIPGAKGDDLMKGDIKDLNGGIYMGDRFGMFEFSLSSHDRKIKMDSPYGTVEIGAFSGITINAPNGDIKIKGKNISIEAGNKLTLHSGQNVKDKKDAGSKVGDFISSAAKSALKPLAGVAKVVDFALLRCVIEVYLRPIEGTLCVKSNNYLMLEAGKGKAQVPVERYIKKYQKRVDLKTTENLVYAKVLAYVNRIDGKIDRFQNDYKELKEDAYKKKEAFEKFVKDVCVSNADIGVHKAAFKLGDGEYVKIEHEEEKPASITGTLKDCLKKFSEHGNPDSILILKPNKGYSVPGHGNIQSANELRGYVKGAADDFGLAVTLLEKKTRQIKTMFDEYTCKAINQSIFGTDEDEETKWIDAAISAESIKACLEGVLGDWTGRYGQMGHDPSANFLGPKDLKAKEDPFNDLSLLKRKLIATFLLNVFESAQNKLDGVVPEQKGKFIKIGYDTINDDLVTKNWEKVATMGDYEKDHKGMLGKLGQFLNETLEITKTYVDGLKDLKEMPQKSKKVWNCQSGQIIYSSSPGTTFAFNRDEIETFNVLNQNNNKDALKKALAQIK